MTLTKRRPTGIHDGPGDTDSRRPPRRTGEFKVPGRERAKWERAAKALAKRLDAAEAAKWARAAKALAKRLDASEAADKAVLEAIFVAFPVGSRIAYKHGVHWIEAFVTGVHGPSAHLRLGVRGVSSGKVYQISFWFEGIRRVG